MCRSASATPARGRNRGNERYAGRHRGRSIGLQELASAARPGIWKWPGLGAYFASATAVSSSITIAPSHGEGSPVLR